MTCLIKIDLLYEHYNIKYILSQCNRNPSPAQSTRVIESLAYQVVVS